MRHISCMFLPTGRRGNHHITQELATNTELGHTNLIQTPAGIWIGENQQGQ